MKVLKKCLLLSLLASLCCVAIPYAVTAQTAPPSPSTTVRSLEVDTLTVETGSRTGGETSTLQTENNDSVKITSDAQGNSSTVFVFSVPQNRTVQTLNLVLDVKSNAQNGAVILIQRESGFAELKTVDLGTDYTYLECEISDVQTAVLNQTVTLKITVSGSQHSVFYDKLSLIANEDAFAGEFSQNYEVTAAEIESGVPSNAPTTLRFRDDSAYSVASESNKVAWHSRVTLDQPATEISSLIVSYAGKASTETNPIWFSLWNDQTGNWDIFATIPLSTETETRRIVLSSPVDIQRHVSPDRDVRLRLYNSHTSQFTRQTDYLNVKVCFTSQKEVSKLQPTSYYAEFGTVSGGLTELSALDGNFITVTSNTQNKVAFQSTFHTDIPSNAIHTLTVNLTTYNTASTNHSYLSLYNYRTSGFVSFKNSSSHATWETLSFSLTDPHEIADYISSSGEIKARVYNSGGTSFTRYIDEGEVLIEKAEHPSFTIAQLSDIHEMVGSQNFQSIIDELNTTVKPDFTIITGDVTDHGTPEQYAAFKEDVARLNGEVYVTPGNHDVRWWNSNGKNDFVHQIGPLYQSFDYQNTHFVLLDSTVFLESEARIDKTQLQWLENDLQSIPGDRPVVYFAHHPFKLNKNGVARNELLRTARNNNLVAFMSGHVHNYGTFTENGIPVTNINYIRDNAEQNYVTIEFTSRYLYVYQHKASDSSKVLWQKYDMDNTRKTTYAIDAVSAAENGDVSVTVSVQNAPDGIQQVKARIDNYGDYTNLTLDSDGTYHAIINSSSYSPVLPYGEHFVGVEVFDNTGLKWNEFAAYSWEGGNFSSAWSFETGGMMQSASTYHDGNLYFSSYDRYVYSVNAVSGALNWSYQTGDCAISKPAVYSASGSTSILVGSNDTYLYSLNAVSGALNWKYKTGGSVISDPLVYNGIVIFGSGDNRIYALNASTGAFLWSRQTNGLMRSQPVVSNNVLYANVRDTYLWYAIDALNGTLVWRGNANANESSFVCGDISPIVLNGKMWCIDANNVRLGYLTAESGALAWTTTAGTTSTKGIATDGTRVFFVTDGGSVVNAIDSATNQIAWSKDLKYNSSDNQADVLNGKVLYQNGYVFHIAERGRISMLDSSSGQLVAQFDAVGLPERNFWCNAEITEHQIFLSGVDGKLYGISYVAP